MVRVTAQADGRAMARHPSFPGGLSRSAGGIALKSGHLYG